MSKIPHRVHLILREEMDFPFSFLFKSLQDAKEFEEYINENYPEFIIFQTHEENILTIGDALVKCDNVLRKLETMEK